MRDTIKLECGGLTSLVITPKAFANSSPGLERQRQPWVTIQNLASTLKGFASGGTLSGLSLFLCIDPRVVAGAPTLGSN